jgi:hypothetical protein
VDEHTSQAQPIIGTPTLVPVPSNMISAVVSALFKIMRSYLRAFRFLTLIEDDPRGLILSTDFNDGQTCFNVTEM